MDISKEIKKARENADVSLSELSKMTKIAKSTLQRYETGTTKKIPMEAISSIEKALNLQTGHLMGWEEQSAQLRNTPIDGDFMDTNEKIKNRRIELGLTMLEVAKRVGVSEATVSRWESGDIANMRRDKIVLLANALQVPASFIMDLNEEVPKKPDLDKELEGIRFALYSESKELTDEDKQAVLDFVRFLKSKEKEE